MRRSRVLAVNALLATLIVIFTMIPLSFGPVSIALLMLLPVIVGSEIEGWRTALFTGFFLGVMSLINSFVMPLPTAPLFNNPMISVFPRIFVGLAAYFVYKGMTRLTKKLKNRTLAKSLSSYFGAVAAVLTNTGLVIGMIWAFYYGKTAGGIAINAEFFTALISLNFVLEIVIVPLVSVPIVLAVTKSLNKPRVITREESEPESIPEGEVVPETADGANDNTDGKSKRHKRKRIKQGE